MDNLSSIGQTALRNGPQSLINENSEPAVYSTIQTVGEGLAQPDPQRSCASPRGGAHARNRAVPAAPPPSGQQRQRLPCQGSRFLHKRHARPYTSDMPGKHTLVLQMCSHESTTRKGLHEIENLTATCHCTLPERKSPTCHAELNVSLLLQPPVLIEMLLQKLGCCHRLRI